MREKISFLNFFIMPVVCLVGLVLEFITALTFYKINKNKKNKSRIYDLLLAYSISDMFILVINLAFGVSNCGSYCSIGTHLSLYMLKQFERIFKIFVCNALYTFNVLVELIIGLDRYQNMKNLKAFNKQYGRSKVFNRLSVFTTCFILLALSFLINVPYLFIYRLDHVSIENLTKQQSFNDSNYNIGFKPRNMLQIRTVKNNGQF